MEPQYGQDNTLYNYWQFPGEFQNMAGALAPKMYLTVIIRYLVNEYITLVPSRLHCRITRTTIIWK